MKSIESKYRRVESNIEGTKEYENVIYPREDIKKQQDKIGIELDGFYKEVKRTPNLYSSREVGKSTINTKTQKKDAVDKNEKNIQKMIENIGMEL